MKNNKKQTTVVVKSNDVKNNIIIFNALLKEIPFEIGRASCRERV